MDIQSIIKTIKNCHYQTMTDSHPLQQVVEPVSYPVIVLHPLIYLPTLISWEVPTLVALHPCRQHNNIWHIHLICFLSPHCISLPMKLIPLCPLIYELVISDRNQNPSCLKKVSISIRVMDIKIINFLNTKSQFFFPKRPKGIYFQPMHEYHCKNMICRIQTW